MLLFFFFLREHRCVKKCSNSNTNILYFQKDKGKAYDVVPKQNRIAAINTLQRTAGNPYSHHCCCGTHVRFSATMEPKSHHRHLAVTLHYASVRKGYFEKIKIKYRMLSETSCEFIKKLRTCLQKYVNFCEIYVCL